MEKNIIDGFFSGRTTSFQNLLKKFAFKALFFTVFFLKFTIKIMGREIVASGELASSNVQLMKFFEHTLKTVSQRFFSEKYLASFAFFY